MKGSRAVCTLTIVVVFVIAKAASAQSITWIGGLSDRGSYPNAISADGLVVVGNSRNATGGRRAFRWEEGVMQDLGTLGGESSDAYALSQDGRVIVGFSYDEGGNERSFRWEDGDMVDIGTLGGNESLAYGVSADGTVIVGESLTSDNQGRAYRLTNGVFQDIGTLNGMSTGTRAVNDDGTVIVGSSRISGSVSHAYRWINGSMQDLGSLNGTSEALGVSGDGTVVVGRSMTSEGVRAFRWTSGSGMQNLGVLTDGNLSQANAASANGMVIIGFSRDHESENRAVRWTESDGIELLNLVYEDLLADGSHLIVATDITPDGRFILGYGHNVTDNSFEGFILDTEESTGTSLVAETGLPDGYTLAQNYPNPFNPSTNISFALPERAEVRLDVFDILGRQTASLIREEMEPGHHSVVFDAGALSSGMYIYRLQTGSKVLSRKMILVK